MKYLIFLLISFQLYCMYLDPPGYGIDRKGCYKYYAGDRKWGICSKEMLLYHYLAKQDPESPEGKLNAQNPVLYDSGIWVGCKEIVEKLKKECDSQHADLNP